MFVKFCHRKNSFRVQVFFSQKQVSVQISVRKKHILVIEQGKSCCQRKKYPSQNLFCHRKKFLSDKKATVTESKQYDLNISKYSAFFT